jgi:hypothetical protein
VSKLLDIYLGSAELKRQIVKRSIDFNIPIKYICQECGVDYPTFMSAYINVSDVSRFEITEEQFTKLINMLGIKVRYQFVIDSEYDGASVSERLKAKNEKFIRRKRYYDLDEKKRDITSLG